MLMTFAVPSDTLQPNEATLAHPVASSDIASLACPGVATDQETRSGESQVRQCASRVEFFGSCYCGAEDGVWAGWEIEVLFEIMFSSVCVKLSFAECRVNGKTRRVRFPGSTSI